MRNEELPNKPLVEAIFELRWSLVETGAKGFARDPGFSILHGKYYDFARKNGYPVSVSLPSSQLPDDMAPNVARYQFRRDKDAWPVTQIGPGILTVNDTKGYKWEIFSKLVMQAVEALKESYPADIHAFAPTRISLKYLDLIPFIPREDVTTQGFLRDHFHINADIDHELFDQQKEKTLDSLRLTLQYKLNNPKGMGLITAGNGVSNGTAGIILETEVRSEVEMPVALAEFESWLETAHAMTSNWFFAICEGKLLDQFRQKSDE
jgi:uncharacterized protein (TIGR04255 family)